MKMKKIVITLLSLTLCVSLLTACSGEMEPTDSISEDTIVTEERSEETSKENVDETIEENVDEIMNEEIEEPAEDNPYAGLTFYESPTGISLYMSDGYVESSSEGTTCIFEGKNNGVIINEETFESMESIGFSSDITLEEYGQLILGAYQIPGEVLTDNYGNTYICYTKNIEGTDITYYGFFDKGSVSFWTTNFMCIAAESSMYEEDFKLWASSIQIP